MARECELCHHEKPSVFRHRQTGKLACQPCYREHLKPKYPCHHCGQERSAEKWLTIDGVRTPICGSCYRKRYLKDDCKYCHHRRRIAMRDDEGLAVCERCYQKFEKLEVCTGCGLSKRVARRIDDRPYCSACRKHQRKECCAGCQQEKEIFNAFEGAPYCRPCFRRVNVEPCSGCQRSRTIYARGRCAQCYYHTRVEAAEHKIAAFKGGTVVYHIRSHIFARIRYVRVPTSKRGLRRPLRAMVVVDINGARYLDAGTTWPITKCRLPSAHFYRPLRPTSSA